MGHPSSVLRGKVLTVPLLEAPACTASLESATAACVAQAAPDTHVLVTVNDALRDALAVWTVSNEVERTVGEWRDLLTPVIQAHAVQADWERALVLRPASEPHAH